MAQLQYFDAKMVAKEANNNYTNFINSEPTKSPYFNNSIRTLFTQWTNEKWDQKQFFFKKRKWFTKQKLYNVDASWQLSEETEAEWLDGTCTDVSYMDWYRFLYYVNKDKTKIRIYKQTKTYDLSDCVDSCYNDIDEWFFVNVSRYSFFMKDANMPTTIDYFPSNDCVFNKFVWTTFVKNLSVSGKEWEHIVAVTQQVWANKFSYLFNEDWTEIWASIWDYLYTWINQNEPHWWEYNLNWYVHIVWATNVGADNFSWWVRFSTTRAPWMDITDDINVVHNVHYNIYNNFWHVLMFASAEWIHVITDIALQWDTNRVMFEVLWDIYTPSVYWNAKFSVQSFTTYNEWIAVLWTNWALYLSWQWYNKAYFSSSNIAWTDGIYYNIKDYLWHLVLIWPDWLGYYMYDYDKQYWDMYTLTDNNWTFSKYSFVQSDDLFMFVRKSKDYYNMQLQFWYWAVKPMVAFWYMNNFLNTDLWMLNRTVDEVSISFDNNKTYIFLNNWTDDTKILIYDRYYQTRYKWYTEWTWLVWVKDWVFFWKWWVYTYEWDTDDWKEYTQIISMTFWDQTHLSTKKVDFIKIALWYNSYFDLNKTLLNIYIDNAWWHEKITYTDLWRTMYVSNLMKANLADWSVDSILYEAPTWVQVRESKWIKVWAEISTLYNEFEEYKHYYDNVTESVENYNTVSLSKFWMLKSNIWEFWEIFTFELVAKWKTGIEFWWFFIWYEYPDADIVRLEDVITERILTGTSWK